MANIGQTIRHAGYEPRYQGLDPRAQAILASLAGIRGLGNLVGGIGDWLLKGEEAGRRRQRFEWERESQEIKGQLASLYTGIPDKRKALVQMQLQALARQKRSEEAAVRGIDTARTPTNQTPKKANDICTNCGMVSSSTCQHVGVAINKLVALLAATVKLKIFFNTHLWAMW